MKLAAITSRGSRKDFIDLWLLKPAATGAEPFRPHWTPGGSVGAP